MGVEGNYIPGSLGILVAAGLLPAVVLMLYIYLKDWREKEPAKMLLKMALFGVLSVIPAVLLENFSQNFLMEMNIQNESVFAGLLALSVGLAEEGSKLLFVWLGSWRSKELNYSFDAIVYCVFVSLGFAALENVLYVVSLGIGAAVGRAVLSVPAHMCFAVVMGVYYGQAKRADLRRESGNCGMNLLLAFLVPALLHGIFDGLLMMPMEFTTPLFFAFVIAMDVTVFRLIRSESRNDVRIY